MKPRNSPNGAPPKKGTDPTVRPILTITDEEIVATWRNRLLESKNGLRVCEYNVASILRFAPEFKDCIRWNSLTKSVEITGGVFEGYPPSTLAGYAAELIQTNYQCMAGEDLVGRALVRVARENAYSPVVEMLDKFKWDGTNRLDTIFQTYFGTVVMSPDHERYLKIVGRSWLISLVARAYKPGCKVDTVVILQGEQGIGKSSALKALVGADYFLDSTFDLNSKDALQIASSAWLIELGELASVRKADVNRLKNFISSDTDKFRPPWGRVVEKFPRPSIFVATTNDEQYLRDKTGNRRYLPVNIGQIDMEGIVRDRELLLAEAVAAFRVSEPWYLSKEDTKLAAIETAEREESFTTQEAIERWWYGLVPAMRPRRFQTLDVIESVSYLSQRQYDKGVQTEIGIALKRIGFNRVQRSVGGKQSRYYEPSTDLLTAPQETPAIRAAGLSLVPKDRPR